MDRNYDMVIFGATGYTGKFVVEEMLKFSTKKPQYRWAIAGRSETRLKNSFKEARSNAGIHDTPEIDILQCDISDEHSLLVMASSTKVVLNCVGPYRFFGEPVVKACVIAGTHHLDISGEPQYLESMQLKYNTFAQEANIFVIGACGFDSIPAEIGIMHLVNRYPDIQWNEVESILRVRTGPSGYKIHFATLQSAIHGFSHRSELKELRQKLFITKLPQPTYKQKTRGLLSYHKEFESWIVPFPGSDSAVVKRTQRYLHEQELRDTFQYAPYYSVPSYCYGLFAYALVTFVFIMGSFRITRKLIEKYPSLFTCGTVSHDGSTREQINASSFSMVFMGKGWMKTDDRASAPDVSKTVEVTGPDPGYVSCSQCLIQAAVTILEDRDKMPAKGGVLTPGAAFLKTDIIDRLEKNTELRIVDRN